MARILIVEDEEALCHLLEKYVTRLGYAVGTARNAEEGLKLFNGGERYDLVIVDLTLPGINGVDFARYLLAGDAAVRIILSSGYPFNLAAIDSGQRVRVAFVQKPYLPHQLAAEIEKLLKPEQSAGPDPSEATGPVT